MPVHDWLDEHLSAGCRSSPARPSVTGRTILTAGIVLAIMILPIITAISREIFAQTPRLHEEAALALGATRWEMVRMTVFPYARSGMVSAVMLGLGRALGETMAVAMVLSASPVVTLNLISNTNPATDRLQHRLELRGGHARQAARADRDRPGAVRGHVRGELRRPLGRGPQRAEDGAMTTTDARRRDLGASLPLAAPRLPALGAGAGRRARASPRPGCRRCCSAGALVGLAGARRWSCSSSRCRLWSLAVENRRAARRPADDRAGLDGLRGRGDPAGLADLDGGQQRARRLINVEFLTYSCATSSARAAASTTR